MTAVGKNVKRKDGIGKATGRTKYADDLVFPGMLYGRTVRTTIPAGRIREMRLKFDKSSFTICDWRDIPGKNVVSLIVDDQPCLVEQDVRHVAEPVLLLAHEDRDALLAADVEIDYDETTPLFDPTASRQVLKELLIEKGNLAKGFDSADLVVEGTYRTGHQEHIYIETNGVVAIPENDGIAVFGSIQCPFYVERALRVLLGPGRHVRVVQTETGGGFGGKEEYPSMIAGHAALLAVKSQRPVKMIYDRVEDMTATTKRHPFIVRHKTGVKKDGTLTAVQVDILVDGGAYITLTPVVVSRGAIHASGPYRCPNVRIHGRAFTTNTPPNGAFRGFGAPQTLFAVEVQMDRIAEQLGMDPVSFRRLNALRVGDSNATGQIMGSDCSTVEVLDEAVRRSDFVEKWKSLRSASDSDGKRRGIGIALYFHG